MTSANTMPAKPRVAVVYRLERAGGVQSCVLALIRGLNAREIVPDLLWDTPPNPRLLLEKRASAGYLPVKFTFPSRTLDRLPFTLRYLANIFNTVDGNALAARYDFFYIFYNGFLLSPGVPHLRYLSGPPLIPELVHTSPGLKGVPARLFERIYRAFLRQSHPAYEVHPGGRYVINSQFTADLFEKAHGIRLPIVHPPVQVPRRGFVDYDWRQRDTITFFSRIIAYKRPDWLLLLAQRFPDHRIMIMGGVPDHRRPYFQSLQQKAASLGLSQVEFLANPSNQRVKEELARARFYVFPAQDEHFGMTTVEAIAAGTVPFVHDSGGQREIVPDERLRFRDEEYLEKFSTLVCLPEAEINAIRGRLFGHISEFSEEVFIRKMLASLDDSLEAPR